MLVTGKYPVTDKRAHSAVLIASVDVKTYQGRKLRGGI